MGAKLSVRVAAVTTAVLVMVAGPVPQGAPAATPPDRGTAVSAPGEPANDVWAAQVEQALREEVGATFGGAWLVGAGTGDDDAAAGELMVGITDPAGSTTVLAAGATPQLVARSEAQLDAIVAALNGNAVQAPVSVPGWYVEVTTNGVVVLAHPGTVPAAQAFVIASGVAVGDVRFVESSGSPELVLDVIGGNRYESGTASCSIGFSVDRGDDEGFVTAGHCGKAGTGTLNPSGQVLMANFPFVGGPPDDNDYAYVRVNPGNNLLGLVNTYQPGVYRTVIGAWEAPVGGQVCRSGFATGWECGAVLQKNYTLNLGQGFVVNGLTHTSACADHGDSGGPYLWGAQAQGVASAIPGGIPCPFGTSLFQPVREVLKAYQLNLVLGPPWTDWTWLDHKIASRLAAVGMGTGPYPVFVFGRGNDGRLYTNRMQGHVWVGWHALPGLSIVGDPAAVVRDNAIEVFAMSGTANLVHRRRNAAGGWEPWVDLGRPSLSPGVALAGSPAAVSLGPDHVEVLVRGTDSALWSRRYLDGAWQPWQAVGPGIVDDPVAVVRDGIIEVVARRTADSLYRTWYDGQWHDWQALPARAMRGTPAAVSRDAGHVDVFARGTDNNLYTSRFTAGSGWSTWLALRNDASVTADPAAVVWNGAIEVFIRQNTEKILRRRWNGQSWQAWIHLNGRATDRPPTAIRQPGGPVHIFVTNTTSSTPYDRVIVNP